MKRLFVALCLLAAPAALLAQAPVTISTSIASALEVQSSVTLSAVGSLDFGSVVGGTTASVDAQGVASAFGVAGAVVLNANQAVLVQATFSDLAAVGMPNLPVTSPSCGYSTASSTSTTNTSFFATSCAAGHTSSAVGTGATGLHVWLGGSVVTTASTPAGNYAGTVTVSGTYTSY